MFRHLLQMIALSSLFGAQAFAAIGEDRVLLIVNASSPVSQQVARMYRQYHPGVSDDQVVYLSGLPDVQAPADEIISRADFEAFIAEPIRQHLIEHELADAVWVLITTAGMPYRIADTNLAQVVLPAASNAAIVGTNCHLVDAASVESELSVLFQIDPALDRPQRAPTAGRIVNPYHGYISPFEEFASAQQRSVVSRRGQFYFDVPLADLSVVFEGTEWYLSRPVDGRSFCAGDLYLVARLDGPRTQGVLPLGAIRRMLEAAARVGDAGSSGFHGYDPAWSAVALDDDPANLDQNQWLNAGGTISSRFTPERYLQAADYPMPPNVYSSGSYRDDLRYAYRSLVDFLPSLDVEQPLLAQMGDDLLGGWGVFDPSLMILSDATLAAYLPPCTGIVGLATFGVNADDNRGSDYLLAGGPDGSRLVSPVYGSLFHSHESFSAVTFFSDATTSQAKVADWLTIGGSGAIGYAFEPLSSSAVDVDLLLYNYLRDRDGDGWGDLTFIEAAYTAMPFVSWAGVVVGDPLMRLVRNPGSGPGIGPPVVPGDADWDGRVTFADYIIWSRANGTMVGDDRYDDRADFDQDGVVDMSDYELWMRNFGYSWQSPCGQS